jgi:hypothetical protein
MAQPVRAHGGATQCAGFCTDGLPYPITPDLFALSIFLPPLSLASPITSQSVFFCGEIGQSVLGKMMQSSLYILECICDFFLKKHAMQRLRLCFFFSKKNISTSLGSDMCVARVCRNGVTILPLVAGSNRQTKYTPTLS